MPVAVTVHARCAAGSAPKGLSGDGVRGSVCISRTILKRVLTALLPALCVLSVLVLGRGTGADSVRPAADVYRASGGQLGGSAATVSDATDGSVVKFAAPNTDGTSFVHPGITVTQTQLNFVRDQITAGRDPWKTYFTQMRAAAPKYGTSLRNDER